MKENRKELTHLQADTGVRPATWPQMLRQLLAILLLTSTLFHLGLADILDPQAKSDHPLLRRLAPGLDRYGLNVRLDWKSHISAHTYKNRPVVTLLPGFPTSGVPDEDKWARDFNRGAMGLLLGFESYGKLRDDTFADQWKGAHQAHRVFLSFAREDLEYAEKVREVLDKEGFVTFMYIKHPGEEPSLSPQAIGLMMREAGVHFVIDTPLARTKPGVLAEAFTVANYVLPLTILNDGRTLLQPQLNPSLLVLKRDVVEIYGGEFCPRTQYAIQHFTEAGADVRFFDVEKNRKARRVLNKHRRWLSRPDLLPYIRINGKSISTQSVEALRIPRNQRVSKVSRTRKGKRTSQAKAVTPSPSSPCTIK